MKKAERDVVLGTLRLLLLAAGGKRLDEEAVRREVERIEKLLRSDA